MYKRQLLDIPALAGLGLLWGGKLAGLIDGSYAGVGLLTRNGFLFDTAEFGALAEHLGTFNLAGIASQARYLEYAAEANGRLASLGLRGMSESGAAIVSKLSPFFDEGSKIGDLFADGGKLAPLLADGSKVGSALGVAGKVLGPLGAAISVVNAGAAFADGNTGRGVYDSVIAVASIAACVPIPPVALVGASVAAVMSVGELVYDHREAIGNALSSAGNAVQEGAKAVGDWLGDHNPFHW